MGFWPSRRICAGAPINQDGHPLSRRPIPFRRSRHVPCSGTSRAPRQMPWGLSPIHALKWAVNLSALTCERRGGGCQDFIKVSLTRFWTKSRQFLADISLTYCFNWCPLRESNPCLHLERVELWGIRNILIWTRIDKGGQKARYIKRV